MNNLEEFKKVKLINEIYHQGIGGKIFQIEKEGTIDYILDTNFDDMTIAMSNFIKRRMDVIVSEEPKKIYYGHILETGLGYFILEDEIESEIE